MIDFIERMFGWGDHAWHRTFGSTRSPQWSSFKKEYEKTHPKVCAACGRKDNVQLHHRRPFHLHPELELVNSNMIWLCENNKEISCHLVIGHWWDFRTKFNPTVEEDSKKWNARWTTKVMDETL